MKWLQFEKKQIMFSFPFYSVFAWKKYLYVYMHM